MRDDVDALKRALRDDDPAALPALYDRCGAALHACLRAMLGSSAAADDALQDVFVAIARRPARVAGASDLDAYVARMARNRAIDLIRRRRASEPLADVAAPPADDEAPAAAVAAALAALPTDQREVVVLKLWRGLTFAQIAAAVAASPNTVASRWRYALEKLRPLLEELRHADR